MKKRRYITRVRKYEVFNFDASSKTKFGVLLDGVGGKYRPSNMLG